MTADGYISKSGLKRRGWTEKAISTFVPDCDKEAINPQFKTASPMKLYRLSRVEEIEEAEQFNAFMQKSALRKNAATKAVGTKKQKLLEELASWEIVIESRPIHEVRRDAIEMYNAFHGMRDDRYASSTSDAGFLERITVNHLRHALSNYDERLEQLFGRVGKTEAYMLLNEKIMYAIAAEYPSLANECERQIYAKITRLNS